MESTTKHKGKQRQETIAAFSAAARTMLGPDFRVEMTPDGIQFPLEIGRPDERPGEPYLRRLVQNQKDGDAFLKQNNQDGLSSSFRCNILRARADALLKKREFTKAAEMYLSAAEAQCRTTLPPRGTRSRIYADLDLRWGVEDVVACLTGAAKALMAMGDYAQALFWLQENLNLYRTTRDKCLKDKPTFEWVYSHRETPQHFLQFSMMHKTLGDVYLKLGNTGAANFYFFQAQISLDRVSPELSNQEHQVLHTEVMKEIKGIAGYLHPEPSLMPRLVVADTRSQIRGSWKRIELKRPGGVTNREGSAAFVHKGYLYTLGGEKFTEGPYYDDFWRLDLSKMNAWEQLPSFPISPRQLFEHPLSRYQIAVGPGDKAYYFRGSQDIDYFDIRKNEWRVFPTKFEIDGVAQRWPYSLYRLREAAMHCIGSKLYVFSGWHHEAQLGCDLLMELDLNRGTWKWLSGEQVPEHPSFESPGPRINACSWVSKDQSKIFYMYGDADLMGAKLTGQKHGASTAHGYDDIWSWDIGARRWTREKLVGNGPSPRTEMSCVYNPVLDKVITFGGYSPSSPTAPRAVGFAFEYSYYADTFICDIRTPKPSSLDRQASAAVFPPLSSPHRHRNTLDASTHTWRQVLTRGFPTYRAQAHLISDPATGKTFLFSGYINSEFVPSVVQKAASSRSFADIWELRLDLPGGGFENVDFEEEARTAKAGPWQRCFGCGSAGPWKKCGGSCGGRVFFCGSQCLKDGWKEHKETHRCRKV